MHKIGFALVAALALFVLAKSSEREVQAGITYPLPAGCSVDKDGFTRRCWGTLRGFRQSTDTQAYATFVSGYDGGSLLWRGFGATHNGVAMGCTVFPWLMDEVVWTQLNLPDTHFVISVGLDGACNLEETHATSYFIP